MRTRGSPGGVVQRHVLYLSEIDDSQELAWRRSIEVLEDGAARPLTLSLFPEDRVEGLLAAASILGVRRRPRQWGACWLALMLWRDGVEFHVSQRELGNMTAGSRESVNKILQNWHRLSAQLGVHLDLEHPTLKAAVRRIAAACNAHGKLARGSAETEAQIEEYWHLGCKVLNLPGNDVSTYLDGMKARADRAHARLKSIGVPTP